MSDRSGATGQPTPTPNEDAERLSGPHADTAGEQSGSPAQRAAFGAPHTPQTNVDMHTVLRRWQASRAQTGEDPLDWDAFRHFAVAEGYHDPGVQEYPTFRQPDDTPHEPYEVRQEPKQDSGLLGRLFGSRQG
jgi:hypothetical protein